jgi:hypothetical protein
MIAAARGAIARQAGERLVYAVSTSGHRQSYLDTLSSLFALEPVSGSMNLALFRRLVAAKRLLFATLDDDMFSFGAIAGMRSVLRRPTAALFVRAQKCFETGRWHHPLKRRAFSALRRLPHLAVASITPFEVAPRHAEVAHAGVLDPQYWDLHDGEALRRPGMTALSDEVLTRAAGRHILCVLGSLTTIKGLEFLAETLERHPRIPERSFVVAAGRVPAASASLTARMTAAGAMIIDRFITDAELESLYGVADSIWACYRPDYDQASGVFGRAIQLGVPPIVRDGSLLATFAAVNSVGHLPLVYGDYDALTELLKSLPARRETARLLSQDERSRLIESWRQMFVQTIEIGLAGAP